MTAGTDWLHASETTVADALEAAAELWAPGQPVPFIARRFASPASRDALPELWAEFCAAARTRNAALSNRDGERVFQLAAALADEVRSMIQHGPRGDAS